MDYDRLPRMLSDPEVVEAWRRTDAWQAWIAAPPDVRRAYVGSVRSDLEQAAR
jgi:hypothetical protein